MIALHEDAYSDGGTSPPRFLGARLRETIRVVYSKSFDQRTPGVNLNGAFFGVASYRKSKNRLGRLYASYAANPSKENLNKLLTDILKYAKFILWAGGYARVVDVAEIAQRVVIKIWASIGDFDGKSKFRSWVHRIVINAALDKIRSAPHELEVPLPEDADSAEILLHYARADEPHNGCYRGPSGQEDYDGGGGDDGDGGVGNRMHIKTRPPSHALIDGRDDEARIELLHEIAESSTAPNWLNEDYRVVLWLTLSGYKPSGIARILKMTTKQVCNQLAATKRILRKHLSNS